MPDVGYAVVIDNSLLQILRCPEDLTPLSSADAGILERLNRAIAAGRVVNLGGERVEKPIENGLVREMGDWLYPIVEQIPVMLPSEAIPLNQLSENDA